MARHARGRIAKPKIKIGMPLFLFVVPSAHLLHLQCIYCFGNKNGDRHTNIRTDRQTSLLMERARPPATPSKKVTEWNSLF